MQKEANTQKIARLAVYLPGPHDVLKVNPYEPVPWAGSPHQVMRREEGGAKPCCTVESYTESDIFKEYASQVSSSPGACANIFLFHSTSISFFVSSKERPNTRFIEIQC